MRRSLLWILPLVLAVFLHAPGVGLAQEEEGEPLSNRQVEMLLAIQDGDLQGLEEALNSGTSPKFTDRQGYSPLAWAVIENQPEMVDLLVRAGDDLSWTDEFGRTLMHFAVSQEKPGMIAALVRAGLDVDVVQGGDPEESFGAGKTALLMAVIREDMESIQELLAEGADPNAVDSNGRSALYWALTSNKPEFVDVLVNAGADINYVDPSGYPLLHRAVRMESFAVLEAIVRAGFPIDTAGGQNPDGRKVEGSALTYAALDGHLEAVKILAGMGADLNFVDGLNGTPLGRAIEGETPAVTDYLKGLGAEEFASDAEGNPLRVGTPPEGSAPFPEGSSGGGSDDNSGGSNDNSSTGGSSGSGSGGTGTSPFAENNEPGSGSGSGSSGGSNRSGSGSGTATVDLRPARPIYEVNVRNVLGGPLSGLWSAFSASHSDWRLDSNGHRHDMDGGVRITGGSKMDALPPDWSAEIYTLGREQGFVPQNPGAPYLVAPKGGTAVVLAQENQIRQSEATREQERQDRGTLGTDGSSSTSASRGGE